MAGTLLETKFGKKDDGIMNIELAKCVLETLVNVGVSEFCLCPAGRNSPLVVTLEKNPDICLYTHFEERAAAFFALGRIKNHGRPVAVVTTSGTASAELLPAVIEAYYSGLPLILLTADRPRRDRGTGAPQAIEQVGLFGPYVTASFDVAVGESLDLQKWDRKFPCHLNVCFDEPLLVETWVENRTGPATPVLPTPREKRGPSEGSSVSPVRFSTPSLDGRGKGEGVLPHLKRPLIILGQLSAEERKKILPILLRWNVPMVAEALSGLRENSVLQDRLILSGDKILEEGMFDSVIRIGNVPTLRFWRDLGGKYKHLPVFVFSSLPFSGLGRENVEVYDLSAIESLPKLEWVCDPLQRDCVPSQGDCNPPQGAGVFYELSKIIPSGSRIFLGNSSPIREWDLHATREDKGFEVAANRGANGIDGELSSFYGWCEAGKSNWAILGDLTTLYDLSAPWVLPQLKNTETNLVVINNGGGQLFSKLFKQEIFINRHQLSFEHWAKMWNLSYVIASSNPFVLSLPRGGPSKDGGHRMIEIPILMSSP